MSLTIEKISKITYRERERERERERVEIKEDRVLQEEAVLLLAGACPGR